MSGLETFRAALLTAVKTVIPRASAYEVDQINPPCAEFVLDTFTYDSDFDGSVEFTGVLRVFGSRAASKAAQQQFDEHISPENIKAMKPALEAASVAQSAGAQYIVVPGGSGPKTVTVGDIGYIAAEFTVEFVL